MRCDMPIDRFSGLRCKEIHTSGARSALTAPRAIQVSAEIRLNSMASE